MATSLSAKRVDGTAEGPDRVEKGYAGCCRRSCGCRLLLLLLPLLISTASGKRLRMRMGSRFRFLLTLKIDGENVTGSSSSQLGDSTIKTGTWKDGKLVFSARRLKTASITLSATVIEGKLSGEFDYAGQLQGKWVAVKKN